VLRRTQRNTRRSAHSTVCGALEAGRADRRHAAILATIEFVMCGPIEAVSDGKKGAENRERIWIAAALNILPFLAREPASNHLP
jgi:hypothetical protein